MFFTAISSIFPSFWYFSFPSWIIMAEGEELWYSIYKARDEKMVSKDGIHTLRIASFLNPLAQVSTKLLRFLTFHCFWNFSENSQKWPSGLLLKGWSMPQKQWEEWLDCLTKDHGSISNQSAICDAIISSRQYASRIVIFLLHGIWRIAACVQEPWLCYHKASFRCKLPTEWRRWHSNFTGYKTHRSAIALCRHSTAYLENLLDGLTRNLKNA